ncbi:hypothetical protein ACP4OV_027010 [Aristida adscensionis]
METPVTASRCTAETEQGKHVFEIFDYSLHRGMGNGELIRSGTFSVGGLDWAIRFYPDGFADSSKGHISVYLELMSKDAKVRASCDISLVDQETGVPTSMSKTGMRIFDSSNSRWFAPLTGSFMERNLFEALPYLRDDHLVIECIVMVRKAPQVSSTKSIKYKIEVPPSNVAEHLASLLDAEGADVTFSVAGEDFAAHKIVLAMRSPVFRAEFFGPMQESRSQTVTIEDMQPAVFMALLHFVYTDPDMDDPKGDAYIEMIRHLLVAADRYAVDRLSLICQNILCENLDAETVGGTMALAYQHNCHKLKEVCLEFITSSHDMDAVVATKGYRNLKRACPSALGDVFEKSMRFRKS